MAKLTESKLESLVYRLGLKLDEYDLFDTDLEARLLQNEIKAVTEGREETLAHKNCDCMLLVN